MSPKKFLSCAAPLAWLLVATACAAAPGDRFDPEDALIVYSGFGYISEDAQPKLSALLVSDKPDYVQPGDALLDSGASAIATEFSATRLQRWSSFPVVTSAQELDKVLAQKLGRATGPEERNRIFEAFDRVYALMFVGGLEYEARQRASFANEASELSRIRLASAVQHEYAMTSVAAVLFDLKRDEIVASATEFDVEHDPGTESELARMSRIARMANSYVASTTKSAALLAKLLQKLDPKKDARQAGLERYSVTDAWILENAGAPVSLFGWKAAERPTNPICKRSVQCSEPGGDCDRLVGLMIHGMTAALSRAGFLTEPAFDWSDWRSGAAHNTKITLSMGRVREPPLALRALDIAPNPATADVKVMPVLTGAEVYTRPAGDGVFESRTWSAMLRYRLVRTDHADCARTVSVAQHPEPTRPAGVGVSPPDTGPVGRSLPPPEADRLQILLAVQSALDGEIRNDLGKSAR